MRRFRSVERVDVAYALIADEQLQKVLLVLNTDNSTWSFPGGAVQSGETLAQAASRETKEEAGVEVRIAELVSVNERVDTERQEHALFATFRAYIVAGKPHTHRPDEVSTVQWVDITEANKYLDYHPQGIWPLLQGKCIYNTEV